MSLHCYCYVFFFKQKTAYEMRISDWSSDGALPIWTTNELGKWYTEGDAVYYQARLPWQAGLIPIGEYLTDINLTAARYYTSEVIDAPDKDVAPNFWDDLRYNVLSYDRGAMYFAMLNGEIVHQSGGTRSIDDLVRAMVAIQRDEGKEPKRVGKECVSTCRSRWSPYH